MADTKITDLASITGANTASADVFPLVDVSDTSMAASGTNKKITKAELLTVFEAAGAAATAQAAAEATAAAALSAHTGDTVDAHDASAISFAAGGTIAGTDVQTAVAEVATDAATALSTHAAVTSSVHGISAFGATLVDDASASAARTTLGLAIGTDVAAQSSLASYLPLVAAGASVENIGAVEANVNTVAATGATETLDTSVYQVHDCTMDQACTFTFSNPAPSGKCSSFVLILRGAFTPTLPASVDWSSGAAPTYTTPSMYTFTTVDAGTTWLGAQVGRAFA